MPEGIQKEVRRRLLVTLSVILFFPSHALASVSPDEMAHVVNRFNSDNMQNQIGYLAFPRSSGLDVRDSFLLGMSLDSSEKPEELKICKSIDDAPCESLTNFTVASILPNCDDSIKIDCIAEFFASDSSGKKLEVELGVEFKEADHNQFAGNAELGIPTGSSPTLYRVPGAPHEFGDHYLAIATRSGHWSRSEGAMKIFDNTSVALYAVKTVAGKFTRFQPSLNTADYQSKNQITTYGTDSNCIYNNSEVCAVATALPIDLNFGFRLRYSSLSQNWFHGRLMNPTVSVEELPRGGVEVVVEGSPVNSSGFFILKQRPDLPPTVVARHDSAAGKGVCVGSDKEASCYDSNLWQTSEGMDNFLDWLDVAGDRASFDPTIWNFNAMNQELNHPRASICTRKGTLVGVVSTNATQYIAGPPTFNEETQDLEYQVAAPHLDSDGEVFKGSYDLTIDKDFARCLYQIDGVVIKATVNVVSESGQLVAATTTQREKSGWMQLSARNFSFSSPIIKVNLLSSNPITATEKNKKSNKKVTCIKGAKSKVLKLGKTKCPKGYKRS